MSYEQELLAEGKCPDLVEIMTEDGPVSGRCMAPIVEVPVPPDARYGETEPQSVAFACEGHTQERLGWRAMSEVEKADWERRNDGY